MKRRIIFSLLFYSVLTSIILLHGCSEKEQKNEVTSIELNSTKVELFPEETFQLIAKVKPDIDIEIIWESRDNNIVSVDNRGLITGIKPGNTDIIAKVNNLSAICSVIVKPINIESLSIDKESVRIKVDESIKLNAIITPENASDKTVIWESSDNKIASVDNNGNVHGVSIGETQITASAGAYSDICIVTVEPILAERISLNCSEKTIALGDTFKIIANIFPENTTDKSIEWNSSDNQIATVDKSGNVTPINLGEVTISAKCGNAKADCKVTIVEALVNGNHEGTEIEEW